MAHTRLLFPVRVGVLSFCTGRKTRESRGATEESTTSLAIGHIRYINILTWIRGFRVKIAIFLSFFCLSKETWIPKKHHQI